MKKNILLSGLAALLLIPSCAGPDPLRLKSERANHTLATRCADGWFQDLPFTAEDQRIVVKALIDWDNALKADEALVGGQQ